MKSNKFYVFLLVVGTSVNVSSCTYETRALCVDAAKHAVRMFKGSDLIATFAIKEYEY